MKVYVTLAGFAFAVLAGAAVWFGGLNQDEGWYLYAANLVADGQVPYRDFFYTQGPLLPLVYSVFTPVWKMFGLLGARVFTCGIGLLAALFAATLARLLVPAERRGAAGVIAFMLLGCNLYHIYYTTIPKTYALAALFAMMGFYLLACAFTELGSRWRKTILFAAGLSLAFAAGARISLGALLGASGLCLLCSFKRNGWAFLWFGLGGAVGLAAVYGPFLASDAARAGLLAAQRYHAARGGFDPVFTVGSVSRLVRWYLPVFVLFGYAVFAAPWRFLSRKEPASHSPARRITVPALLWSFLAVFVVQMLAPFPYEDYNVPIMGLLAVVAAVFLAETDLAPKCLLALGLTWACSFGSPLLETWMTNGQDRFWSLKKEKSELAQLRDVARVIEAVDPDGKTILTQDTYLAIETRRKVPKGLEMGPFSMLTDAEWRELLSTCDAPVAALSGYTFAVNPPVCDERDWSQQKAYWEILRGRYDLVMREEAFGQHATPLLILTRKESEE